MTYCPAGRQAFSCKEQTLSIQCTVSRDGSLGCCASCVDATDVKTLHRAVLAAHLAICACEVAAGESYTTCSFSSSRALDTASSRCIDTGNVSAGVLALQMKTRRIQAAHLHIKLVHVLLDCCIKLILHHKHLPSDLLV